jgi:tRNA-dihydrouridine synthase
MSRELLREAVDGVETARDATDDSGIADSLAELATHLQSHAEREATPALGTLDRVQTKLRAIESETSDPTVSESLAAAREHILSFLDTLDDRGMQQH